MSLRDSSAWGTTGPVSPHPSTERFAGIQTGRRADIQADGRACWVSAGQSFCLFLSQSVSPSWPTVLDLDMWLRCARSMGGGGAVLSPLQIPTQPAVHPRLVATNLGRSMGRIWFRALLRSLAGDELGRGNGRKRGGLTYYSEDDVDLLVLRYHWWRRLTAEVVWHACQLSTIQLDWGP